MRRLVCACVVRKPPKTGFLALRPICVNCVLCLSCFRVCSLLPCGHLKGKGWPLGSCLWCLLWFCNFPIWYCAWLYRLLILAVFLTLKPSTRQGRCRFCNGQHWSNECQSFATSDERKQRIKGSCFIYMKQDQRLRECGLKKPKVKCHQWIIIIEDVTCMLLLLQIWRILYKCSCFIEFIKWVGEKR